MKRSTESLEDRTLLAVFSYAGATGSMTIDADAAQVDDIAFTVDGTMVQIQLGNSDTFTAGALSGSFDFSITNGNSTLSFDTTNTPLNTLVINLGDQNDALSVDDRSGATIALTVNGGNGSDTLTVDLTGQDENDPLNIVFNGDGGSGNDTLEIVDNDGGTEAGHVRYRFTNATDGFVDVDVDGNSAFETAIAYTGLEPITSSISATDVTLNYSAAAETITVTNAGGNQTTVDSTAGELVTFNDPSGTLTINAGDTGNDTIDIDSLAASYPATLIIDGEGGTDTVNLNGAVTFAANKSLTVNADTINAPNAASDIITSGTGAIDLTATRNIALGSGSSLTTVDGGVTLTANSAGTATGTFSGINIDNATIQTTGTGAVSLDGQGTDSGGANSNLNGILLQNGATFSSTATGATAGTITIDGTGGDGTTLNHGVLLDASSSVTSVDGSISITGAGGAGNANFNIGAVILGAVSSTGTDANAATITVDGTGGGGTDNNYGVSIEGASADITSVTGAVQILGTGGTGGNFHHAVNLQGDGSVQVTSAPLTVTGIATNGDSIGVRLSEQSGGRLVSIGSGTITVNATATGSLPDLIAGSDSIIGDATHAGAGSAATGAIDINADTIDWSGTLSVESGGALTIQPRTASTTIGLGGGAGSLNLDDTELGFLQDGFSSITIGDATSGDIDVDTTTFNDPVTLITGGEIHDAVSGTDIDAGTDSVTLDGTIAPGQSPGILVVNGNFAFADNSTFEVEIGGTSPGTAMTDHDQIDVTGTVTIGSNVTLDLQQFNGFTLSAGDAFVIVNNDAADAVTGTFAGLAEGTTISNFFGSGLDATVSYVGGDGNDIVLAAQSNTVDVNGGDLDITTPGSDDDMLRIVIDGGNYRISRVGGNLTAGNGATQDGNDVLVPRASLTGEINVTTSGGDDDLEVDFSGGIITPVINFDGGGQTSSDSLTFTAATVTSVTHSFTNASDGSVDVVIGGMTSTINYIGLEPIDDNLNATDRVFEFTGADETVMLSDDGDAGDGQSFIDSDLGESVTFNNPTGSLTIEVNTSGGADDISVSGLDSLFDADLTINGGNDDFVTFVAGPTDVGTGNLIARGVAVGVFIGGSITTSGGSLTFETTEEMFINGDVSSGGGNIIFNADTDQAVTPDGSVVIEDAMVTSGGGNIVIGGGADPTMTPTVGTAVAPHPDGVYIHRSTLNSGTGDISILGSADNNEDGVDIGDESTVMSTTGNITIDGTGTGLDDGVDLHGGSTISTTTGDISITGTASGGTAEDGVLISGAGPGQETTVSTQTGSITISGNGANLDSGVELSGFVIVESTGATGAGTITIDGTSANPDQGDDEAGTSILNSIVRSVSGPIDIDGASTNESAVVLDFGTMIQSTGTGTDAATISLTGDASTAGDFGIVVSDSTVTSVDGDIELTGTDTQRAGVLLFGGIISSTGATTDAAAITIMGTSSGIDGVALADSGGSGSQVTSVAGDIQVTGDATGATDNGVTIEEDSSIASTGSGATAAGITINGTSGVERGVSVEGTINTVDGAVMITGDASNGTDGVHVDNLIEATGTGTISINGTGNSGAGTPTGVFIDNDVISLSGMITVQTAVGRVAIDSEDSVSSQSGNISIMTTDTTATGDDIELIGSATISSMSGQVTLTSGDDIVHPVAATIRATANSIILTVDSGNADASVGGNADLIGVVSGLSLTGTGGPDNDLIRLPSNIFGFNGVATLTGNAGNDTLTGGGGSDTIIGGTGNDQLSGDDGDDLFQWNNGDGSDMIDGGADTDELEVNGSTVSPTGDQITVSASGARFDLTRADGGAGLGPFSLDVGTVETLDLNTMDGDDNVTVNDLTGVADLVTLQIDAGAGNDTVNASALPDLGLSILLEGGDNDDTLTGAAGSSILNGNMGNDSLIGGVSADTVMGGGGDDVMNGGAGGDMLSGHAGDDTMTGGLGNDTMNGGANADRIIESRDADFDLSDATLTISPAETDTLVDVEEADLTGGVSANTIDASDFSGTATLMGGDNDDTITGAMGSSVINGNMGNDELTGQDADDTIMGGGNDDILNGGGGADMLTGQAGNDTLTGGTDDDTINGGANTDQVAETRDADFDLGDASLTISPTETDTLIDVEEADLTGGASINTIDAADFSGVATLMGGSGNDTITGAMGASVINGNADDDSLLGLGASDTIMGGAGNDNIDGGAGADTLTGQASDDTITGNLGDDSIMGGDGADLINGSLGNDTINGDAGNDRIQGSNQTDYPGTPLSPIPDLNTLGLTDRDSLLGGAGSDTIAGAIGADFIDGEADADIIDAQSGGDTTNGIDTIAADMADTIFRDPEDTVL